MIKKIIALLIVIGIVGGGTWFLLSNAPSKSVEKYRKKIDTLLKSKDSAEWESVTTPKEREGKDLNDILTRVDIARQASDEILKMFPNSEYDLSTRGAIEEIAGGKKEALKWFDRIASLKNPPALNELRRAAILKKMGLIQKAKGAVAGVVDVYPYEANFELGQLYLDSFQPLEAYRSFTRAKEYVNNDNELRQVLEGIADSLDRLMASTHNQIQISKNKGAKESQINALNKMLSRLKVERDKNLDDAIELLGKIEPRSRGQFVGIQIKMYKLINKKDDPDKLKTARQALIDSVSSDQDLRYFPIYILLGAINLQLGYKENTPQDERTKYLEDAVDNFLKVFAFDFEGKTAKVADVAEWNLSEHLSREEFEARVLLRICRTLLIFPEYWRILAGKDSKGEQDPLEIQNRLQSAIAANKDKKIILQEIKSTQALAELKNNNLDEFHKLIEELFAAAEENERSNLALKLAQDVANVSPIHAKLVMDLLNNYVFTKIQSLEDDEGQALIQLNSAIGILNQARSKQYRESQRLRQKGSEEHDYAAENTALLTSKIRETIFMIMRMSTTPAHFLSSSKLMASLVGPLETLDILKEAVKQFPDDFQLRYALGMHRLDLVRKDLKKNAWEHLHNATKEFLILYVSRPYEAQILRQLISIGTQYKNNPNSPGMDLKETVSELFPKGSESDIATLSTILTAFLQRNLNEAISNLPDVNSAKEIRPFLNLIGGICYLEKAGATLKTRLADNVLLSGDSPSDNFKIQFNEFYQNAKKEFEAGLAIDNTYIPLRLELIKMDLNAIKPGEEITEDFIDQLKDLRDEHPEIPQIHFLLGAAFKSKCEFLIKTNSKLATISKFLTRRRTALRRAIKANTSYTEAYIALAETYVIPWRLAKGPLREYKNSFNKLGTPEFDVAISILKGAPSSPQVISLIGEYFQAQRTPEKAREYYKALVQLEPVMSNVSKVVQSYLDMGDFKGARDWLENLNSPGLGNDNFEVTRNTLMAYISSVEADNPATSDHSRNLLEESQIKQYSEIISQSKDLGKEPPILVVNNLAYLLASKGKAEEALTLIEPLVQKLRSSKGKLTTSPFEDIEDTYAWSLYKAGKKEKAMEIYKNLCSKETRLTIHLNYAQFLFELSQYQEALNQIQIILNSDKKEKRKIEEKTRDLQAQIELALKQ